MDIAEYLHERDVYYVVEELHLISLAMAPPYKIHTYNLLHHRSLKSPRFPAQRRVLKFLQENGIIIIEECFSKNGKPTEFSKATSYRFKRSDGDLLRKYQSRLMLKLDEAHLNHQALTETGTLFLDTDGEYVYVRFPYHKLRVNSKVLRANQTPQFFFEHLIEVAKGAVVTRETLPIQTSRSFEDLAFNASFEGKIRKVFLPILEKNRIQLLTEVEMNIKDSTEIYRQLMRDEYNKKTYERYMEGIE